MNIQLTRQERACCARLSGLWMLVICVMVLLLSACGQPDTLGNSAAPTGTSPVAPTTGVAESANALGSSVRALHLITATTGWVLTDKRILWTTNAGRDWTDLQLPKQVQPTSVQNAFFLGDDQGWLVFTQPGVGTTKQPGLAIVHTSNGGKSWDHDSNLSAQITDPSPTSEDVSIDFIDSQHGWVMVRLESGSAFSVGALLRTQDGGLSWTPVAAPSGEAVRFLTSSDGWTTNSVQGKLYVTHDGGQSWQPQPIPLTADEATSLLTYDLPTFSTRHDGVLPVTMTGERASVSFYVTHDGGQSWTRATTVPSPMSVARGTKITTALLDSNTWIIPFPNEKLHRTKDSGRSWQTSPNSLPAGIIDLSFATSMNGWAERSINTCAQFKAQCSHQTGVLATTDGGLNWTQVLSLTASD